MNLWIANIEGIHSAKDDLFICGCAKVFLEL